MQVLGHRGSRRPGPENTPEAVRAALTSGADGSEIDVRRTADGGLVCVHDPMVQGRPVITQTTKELAAVGVFGLPEVMAAATGGRLVIEVKNDSREPDFNAGALAAQWLTKALHGLIGPPAAAAQDVLISSFDLVAVGVARDSGWRTAFLSPPLMSLTKGAARARRAGCDELHAHISVIGASKSVAAVRDSGLGLIAWTVTSERQARRLRRLGIDGVICDDPAATVSALADDSWTPRNI